MVIAVVRATVQLAAVSAVLLVVVRSLLLSTLFVLLMLTRGDGDRRPDA